MLRWQKQWAYQQMSMRIKKVTKEYFETEDEKVYFFEPLEKEISIKDMQKILSTSEELVIKLRKKLCKKIK